MNVTVLAGGVGGARLIDGLASVVNPASLTAVVNTGDDFVHWGLRVSPDLDSVMYTLGGVAHEQRGWGVAGDTFAALDAMRRLGGETWFQIGDRDLATHLVRTDLLARNESLSAATRRLCEALGVSVRVVPMTDAPRPTMIDTREHGTLTFQDWFVRRRAEPTVTRVWFHGDPAPAREALSAIRRADVVLIAPSNPYVSIDPILTLPGVRACVAARPVVAVSPIVRGAAVKGPLARMIVELDGDRPGAAAIARHYAGLLRGFVVETGDERGIEGPALLSTSIVMRDREDRARLAREVLAFAERLLGLEPRGDAGRATDARATSDAEMPSDARPRSGEASTKPGAGAG